MNSFGERLKYERERLELSQEAFGEIGGVQKLAQRNYEKNNRSPDAAYMAAIAAAGADVLYIITGQRSSETSGLSRRETALLDNYRHCAREDQATLERVALNAAKPKQGTLNKNTKTAS